MAYLICEKVKTCVQLFWYKVASTKNYLQCCETNLSCANHNRTGQLLSFWRRPCRLCVAYTCVVVAQEKVYIIIAECSGQPLT